MERMEMRVTSNAFGVCNENVASLFWRADSAEKLIHKSNFSSMVSVRTYICLFIFAFIGLSVGLSDKWTVIIIGWVKRIIVLSRYDCILDIKYWIMDIGYRWIMGIMDNGYNYTSIITSINTSIITSKITSENWECHIASDNDNVKICRWCIVYLQNAYIFSTCYDKISIWKVWIDATENSLFST